ncbi:MAG: hypothetical protein GC145_03120 [Caulobacter sp.]|nr:hypothetical protein [Caulobacter sp.]
MFRTVCLAGAVALMAGAVQAQAADRIHFANVTGGDVTLQVDSASPLLAGRGNWRTTEAAAGTHRITVHPTSGADDVESWSFKAEELTPFGVNRYWCVGYIGGSGEAPLLMKLTADQCKRVLDAGGPIN